MAREKWQGPIPKDVVDFTLRGTGIGAMFAGEHDLFEAIFRSKRADEFIGGIIMILMSAGFYFVPEISHTYHQSADRLGKRLRSRK